MKKMLVIMAVTIFTAIIIVTGLVFMAILQNENNYEIVDTSNENRIVEIFEPVSKDDAYQNEYIIQGEIPSVTSLETLDITNVPVPTTTSNEESNTGESFASIVISTIKRTSTYEIMPDVNENTLKKNIGWLPSSSLPNQEGVCILMGHRDTDFSILKYAQIGDKFTIRMNGFELKYSVSAIDIVNSDNELRFKAHNGSTLLLVTCYPFRYSGHAPQKILFYAEKYY